MNPDYDQLRSVPNGLLPALGKPIDLDVEIYLGKRDYTPKS